VGERSKECDWDVYSVYQEVLPNVFGQDYQAIQALEFLSMVTVTYRDALHSIMSQSGPVSFLYLSRVLGFDVNNR